MKSPLTKEEIEVLSEYINFSKHEAGIFTVDMFEKRLSYDYDHGKGEAVELLNKHFYEITSNNELKDHHIRRLVKEIIHREFKWIAGENFEFNFDDVIFDGFGYVVLSDGTRIDLDSESYQKEREIYTKLQAARLASQPTNGKEFLR